MLRVGGEAAPLLRELLDRLGWPMDSIDHFVLHQPGHSMHQRFIEAAGIDPKRALNVHPIYGNAASVSVSMAFHEYLERYSPRDGARLVLVATGAGMTGCVIAGEWVE
jgi:3-oxoacyl-[acyl-carrier-protein] synthase-3